MDPVIHLSEGHLSDTLLGSERIDTRRASNGTGSSSHIHVFTSVRVKDLRRGKGKDGFKRVDTSNARWVRGKGKGKHTGSGKPRASARHANPTSVEDYDYYEEDMDESANAY